MSFTEDNIDLLIDDKNNIIHFKLKENEFYNLNYNHIYYDSDYLEDYNHISDFPIHFHYSSDDIVFKYDGYFRLNSDNTLKFKYCTLKSENEDMSFYRLREFNNIKNLDELIDIFCNKVLHIYKKYYYNDNNQLEYYIKEFEDF